jgi:protoheme IX farnesyltransferase
MSRALALLKSSHPEPGGAVTLAMTLLAVGVGHRGWAILGVAAAVGATQLSVGWVNDWLDADRDRVAGRSDKPVASGDVSRRTVGISGLISALLIPVLGLPFGVAATICITLVGVFALLYDWPLKSTALSVVPYLVAFGLLPAFVVVALPSHPAPPAWLVAAGALLGGGAHFANVLPDLEDDLRTGVRGLPHRLGAQASAVWARAGRSWPPRRCCWPRRSRWSSDPPDRRRGPAWRRSQPPSWPCLSAGTRRAEQPDGRWRCSAP